MWGKRCQDRPKSDPKKKSFGRGSIRTPSRRGLTILKKEQQFEFRLHGQVCFQILMPFRSIAFCSFYSASKPFKLSQSFPIALNVGCQSVRGKG
jgi:hypothetical protein